MMGRISTALPGSEHDFNLLSAARIEPTSNPRPFHFPNYSENHLQSQSAGRSQRSDLPYLQGRLLLSLGRHTY
jgi:hypothetical protein